MEVPAWMFFSFWALTGVVSLFLGIETLYKTDLPNSISPVILSLFKHSLSLCTCHSSTYALIFRPKLNIQVKKYNLWVLFAVSPIIFSRIVGESSPLNKYYFPIYCLINLLFLLFFQFFFFKGYFYKFIFVTALLPLLRYFSLDEPFQRYITIYISNFMIIFRYPFATVPEEKMGLFIHFAGVSSLIFLDGKTKYYFPHLVLCFAFITSAAQAAICGDERFQNCLPVAAVRENRIVLKLKKMMKKNGKVIEFAIGMWGSILFHNFFPLTSFDHVVAFLYVAVAWLANLALLLSNHDMGIFNFFLSNVIVGCTVSEFGLRGTTWAAYGVSVLLYVLRMKLEGLVVVKRREAEAAVVWRD